MIKTNVFFDFTDSQVAAQSKALVQDQTIRVPVTLPVWNGGSGVQQLTVRLTAYVKSLLYMLVVLVV